MFQWTGLSDCSSSPVIIIKLGTSACHCLLNSKCLQTSLLSLTFFLNLAYAFILQCVVNVVYGLIWFSIHADLNSKAGKFWYLRNVSLRTEVIFSFYQPDKYEWWLLSIKRGQLFGFVWLYSFLKWTHTHIPLNSRFMSYIVTQIVIGCGHDWHFNRCLAKHSTELRGNSLRCMNMCLCVAVFDPLLHFVAAQTECAWNSDGLIETCFIPHLPHSSAEDYWRGQEAKEKGWRRGEIRRLE